MFSSEHPKEEWWMRDPDVLLDDECEYQKYLKIIRQCTLKAKKTLHKNNQNFNIVIQRYMIDTAIKQQHREQLKITKFDLIAMIYSLHPTIINSIQDCRQIE